MLDANKSILKWIPSDHDPEADSVLGRGSTTNIMKYKKKHISEHMVMWREKIKAC